VAKRSTTGVTAMSDPLPWAASSGSGAAAAAQQCAATLVWLPMSAGPLSIQATSRRV
jgi:hypothetical protein